MRLKNRRISRVKLIAVLATLALLVAACGDDEEESVTTAAAQPDTTTATTAAAEPTPETTTATTRATTTTTAAPEMEEEEEEMEEEEEEMEEEVTETTQAGPTRVEGGILRMVIGTEPKSLNPSIATSRFAQQISRGIIDVLMEKDVNNHPEPSGLITAYEQVDGLTWRFTVREGVSFHNGEPFNAEAAAASVRANRDTGGLRVYFTLIADAQAIDDTTFEIITTTETGIGLLPALLTETFVFPPAYLAEVGADEFGLAPVGTGPLVFEEWIPGERISASANPDYWNGAPTLDGVEWTWAPDANTRLALLQTGDADMIVTLSPQLFDDVEADDNLVLSAAPGGNKFFMGMNIHAPPMDDIRLRQAIAHAIDREALVGGVLEGRGGIANPNAFHNFFSSTGRHADDYYPYDPDRARELVAEVQAEGDIPPIPINYTVGRYISDKDMGEAVVGMLEAVGLPLEARALEPGEFIVALFTNQLGGTHQLPFDVRYPHEDVFMRTTFTSAGLVKACTSDRLDELATIGATAQTEEERIAAYSEVERIVLIDLVCWVSIYDQVDNFAYTTGLGGFHQRLDLQIDYEGLYFQE